MMISSFIQQNECQCVSREFEKNTEILKIILVIFLVGIGPPPLTGRVACLNLRQKQGRGGRNY
jgi:hypothetical protein